MSTLIFIFHRYGYPLAFLSRQELIGVLYHSFQDNSHIRTGQQVAKLEDLKDRVRVTTKSGVTYEGDLVVGADGVHSQVRSEMWSFSNSPYLGRISSQEQKGIPTNPTYARSLDYSDAFKRIDGRILMRLWNFIGRARTRHWRTSGLLSRWLHNHDIPRPGRTGILVHCSKA